MEIKKWNVGIDGTNAGAGSEANGKRVYIRKSKTGKGLYFFNQSGDTIYFGNVGHMQELLIGTKNFVVFTGRKVGEEDE